MEEVREPIIPNSEELANMQNRADDDLMTATSDAAWQSALTQAGYSLDVMSNDDINKTVDTLKKEERLTSQRITALFLGRCWETTGHENFIEFVKAMLPFSVQTAYRKIRVELTLVWMKALKPDVQPPHMSERTIIEFSKLPAVLREKIYSDCLTAINMTGAKEITSHTYETVARGLVTPRKRLAASMPEIQVPQSTSTALRPVDDVPITEYVLPERDTVVVIDTEIVNRETPDLAVRIVAWYAAALCAVLEDEWGDTTFTSVETPFTDEEIQAIAGTDAHTRLMELIGRKAMII